MKKGIKSKLYTGSLTLVAGALILNQLGLVNDKGEEVLANNNNSTSYVNSLSDNSDNFYEKSTNYEDNIQKTSFFNEAPSNQYESYESYVVTASEPISGTVVDGVQVVEFDLESNSYPSLELQPGPVKLIINADENSLNSCNYSITSIDLGFRQDLNVGENIIEFNAEEGQYVYTCWMGMLGANIYVSSDNTTKAFYEENVSGFSSCCGGF